MCPPPTGRARLCTGGRHCTCTHPVLVRMRSRTWAVPSGTQSPNCQDGGFRGARAHQRAVVRRPAQRCRRRINNKREEKPHCPAGERKSYPQNANAAPLLQPAIPPPWHARRATTANSEVGAGAADTAAAGHPSATTPAMTSILTPRSASCSLDRRSSGAGPPLLFPATSHPRYLTGFHVRPWLQERASLQREETPNTSSCLGRICAPSDGRILRPPATTITAKQLHGPSKPRRLPQVALHNGEYETERHKARSPTPPLSCQP
jgi:hypothetical protein